MQLETKALGPMEVKASSKADRTFSGWSSTDDEDLGGDVVLPTAFARTLELWRQGKRIIPLLDSHEQRGIRHVLGKLVDAEIRRESLWTKFEVVAGETGDLLLRLIERGMLGGLSIGYRVVKSRPEAIAGRSVRVLEELDLFEVSAVAFPMNPFARIEGVGKAGAGLLERPSGLTPTDPRRRKIEAMVSELEAREACEIRARDAEAARLIRNLEDQVWKQATRAAREMRAREAVLRGLEAREAARREAVLRELTLRRPVAV